MNSLHFLPIAINPSMCLFFQIFLSLMFPFPESWTISQLIDHHCQSPHVFEFQATFLSTQNGFCSIRNSVHWEGFLFHWYLSGPPLSVMNLWSVVPKLTYPWTNFSIFTLPTASHKGPPTPTWAQVWAEGGALVQFDGWQGPSPHAAYLGPLALPVPDPRHVGS